MLIKGSAPAQSDTTLSPGALVCYEQDGALLIACIREFKKPRYVLFNQRGREIELTAERLHRLPGRLPPEIAGSDEKTAWLTTLDTECRQKSLGINLEEIWTLIHEDHHEMDNLKLCQLYFGRDDLQEHLALRHALIEDRIYFKRKREAFCARSKETVEELKKAELSRQKKATLHDLLISSFKERLADHSTPLPQEIGKMLALLEDAAADVPEMENSRRKEAKDLITRISEELQLELFGTIPERAYSILERVNHFSNNTNLCLIRHKPSIEFSETAEKQAAEIHVPASMEDLPEESRQHRRDLTEVRAFTVDDASTRDMDDALSLEQDGEDLLLGIHITDVASLVAPASALEQEAQARATSIYCPDIVINMLPTSLSEEKLSLVCGQVRQAFSFICRFSHDFTLTGFEMFPSLIKVDRRLSYDEVDDLLEREDPDFIKLYNIASALEEERFKQGGFKVNKRDAGVILSSTGELELVEIDESAPGRALVGEIMVLANRLLAGFAADRKIPLVFRGQEQPDPSGDAALARIPAGPAQDYAVRARLKKSTISFKPQAHATLGLDAYAQSTSPIRRFTDLLNQRQIINFLQTGSPFYSASQLEKHCQALEEPLKTAVSVTRESKRFWLLRYLQKMVAEKEKISGVVIRTDLSNPLVELDRIYLPLFARFQRKVSLGDAVNIKVSALDPRYDYVRLEGE